MISRIKSSLCENSENMIEQKICNFQCFTFYKYIKIIGLCVCYAAIVVVQSLSCVRLFVTPWTAAHQASLSFSISQSCSNSCPLSQWSRPTISSSVISFSSCPPSFPASESFLISWHFTSGSQSIGDLASISVFPKDIQD